MLLFVKTRNFHFVQHIKSIEVRTVTVNLQTIWDKFEHFMINTLGDARRGDALRVIVQQ